MIQVIKLVHEYQYQYQKELQRTMRFLKMHLRDTGARHDGIYLQYQLMGSGNVSIWNKGHSQSHSK